MSDPVIVGVVGRRIWDSRGRPTLEVEIRIEGGERGIGAAPAGASRGDNEAIEIRDGGPRLGGLDVGRAIGIVDEKVAPALLGLIASDQTRIDSKLDELDPTPGRSLVGGNVTVATSIAALKAAAAHAGNPLWRHLSQEPTRIPRPEVQMIGGGAHAGRVLEVQDFMVIPLSTTRVGDALAQVAEVYLQTGILLSERYQPAGLADEGGYWPVVANAESALATITEAIGLAGLVPGVDMGISLDVAASEFFDDGGYMLVSEGRRLNRAAWLDRLCEWCAAYPIVAIEDPVESRDGDGMKEITDRLGDSVLIIGDDYLVTDVKRIRQAAEKQAVNAALIKPNQTGTLTAARRAMDAAKSAGLATVVSARSGETEDTVVADLATGWQADLIKVGSIARGERTAKWNQLIRIDAHSGGLELAPFPYLRQSLGTDPT